MREKKRLRASLPVVGIVVAVLAVLLASAEPASAQLPSGIEKDRDTLNDNNNGDDPTPNVGRTGGVDVDSHTSDKLFAVASVTDELAYSLCCAGAFASCAAGCYGNVGVFVCERVGPRGCFSLCECL